MNYQAAYERWVNSPALTEAERAELLAIACDEGECGEHGRSRKHKSHGA